MMKRKMFLLAIVMMLGVNCFADKNDPTIIFNKVISKYKSIKTYQAEGTIVSDAIFSGKNMKTETSFSMKLKKPNSYLITWTQKDSHKPDKSQSGAVWNAGNQPYFYMGIMNAYSKMNNDEWALGSATGISRGAAFTIPSLFLSVFKDQSSSFSRLIDPKLEKSEKVKNEECYVISGASTVSKKETYWISKKTYLILKYSRSLEQPEGGSTFTELDDKQLEEAIKSMGQEVTKESKENMRNMMKMAKNTLKTSKIKGISTEVHHKISTPKFTTKDFKFNLPAGTILKKSLFGSVLGNNE